MTILAPLDYPLLLANLLEQGVSVRSAGAAAPLATTVDRHADGSVQLAYDEPDSARMAAVASALQHEGLVVEHLPGVGMQILGRRLDHNLLLAFDLPLRLPSFNPQLRTHWATKAKRVKALAWEIHAAVPLKLRPRTPFQGIEVEIDRHCTIEPDEENLKASGKWLLDVLQPMHPVRRPYGLGIILEDAPSCLHALRVNHIQSSRRFTAVRIYRSSRKEA